MLRGARCNQVSLTRAWPSRAQARPDPRGSIHAAREEWDAEGPEARTGQLEQLEQTSEVFWRGNI